MKRIGLVCLLLTATISAPAQLGWTLDQCKRKYGEPLWTGTVRGFLQYGWERGLQDISAFFQEGSGSKAAIVLYMSEMPLTDTDRQQILDGNLPGASWQKLGPNTWMAFVNHVTFLAVNYDVQEQKPHCLLLGSVEAMSAFKAQ